MKSGFSFMFPPRHPNSVLNQGHFKKDHNSSLSNLADLDEQKAEVKSANHNYSQLKSIRDDTTFDYI